ncbi:B- and T-lymphocyte attenuator-like isoform X2 [Cheilinus undulatus]|uniref:B- and T-lymphocyte attenuator-like isoform X2 n=1 Tax=Cheilinus undulatus TaxID=241271 RepID=UPI001BD1FA03|nr:B- and T-lymphocyte attenuator-like isoform X2 [Cheilinus undulatus]
MRPKKCWTLLHVSVLAVLLLATKADSEDECEVQIRVSRNKKYNALLGEELQIECPVNFCNNSPPTISWSKLEETNIPVNVSPGSGFRTEWKTLKDLNGVFVLIIQNFVRNDSGVYQCQSGSTMGHKINVSVNDSTTGSSGLQLDFWTYVYVAAGIAAFVVIVIIVSVASMQGCKGKSKKEIMEDSQYVVIPMVENPFPNPVQPSPRGSPAVPLARRSTRRKMPHSQPNKSPLPRDECVYSRVKEDRDRQRNTLEEEGGSVVYAALNHEIPPRAPARPRRQIEERSEYAAIRIRDPNSS